MTDRSIRERARPGRPPRPERRLRGGVSLLELLIVVALVAAITGVGSLYYRGLMAEANEERARADMRTLAKGILKLESDQQVTIRPGGPHPRMEPTGLGVNDSPPDEWNPLGGFTLQKLLDFRIVTGIPEDPYQFPYRIDIAGGFLLSTGRDGAIGGGDDLQIAFRPPFTLKTARFIESRKAIEVEFSRKIDPFSLFADDPTNLCLQLLVNTTPADPATVTTASRHITNPFAAIVRLTSKVLTSPPPTSVEIRVVSDPTLPSTPSWARGVQAMDTAYLGGTFQIPVTNF